MTDFEAEFARRNALAHALAMVPCLLDRTFPQMRRTAEESLVRALPQLRRDDALWVNREQVRALLKALDPARPAMTVAILGAVGQVCDKRAILRVKEVFARVAQTSDPGEALVRDAAYTCLVLLQENTARSMEANGLLRGSQPPAADAGAMLLRAAAEGGLSASAQLLRASATDDCSEVTKGESDGPQP